MTDILRSWHETEFRATGEDHRVTAVISTEGLGRDGAIIRADGWRLDAFKRNPVVLWMHDGVPIGRAEHTRTEGKKLLSDVVFDPDDETAMMVERKVRSRFLHTTSVRWKPRRTSVKQMKVDGKDRDVLIFEEQDLLEWSFVNVPADPGAVVVRALTGEAVRVEDVVAEAERIAAEAEDDDEPARELEPLHDNEVPPIWSGRAAIAAHSTAVDKSGAWDGPKAVANAPNDRRVLRHMHAIFRGGDADVKGNYALPHHAPRAGSPANLRGVNNAKSRLPQTQGIDAATRRGAEQHLNRHQRDAGAGDEEQANLSLLEDSAWETAYQLQHAGVVTPEEQEALRSLHSAIGLALGLDTAEQVAELEREVRELVAACKAQPHPRDLVIDTLARLTGRSPERIRKEIAHG